MRDDAVRSVETRDDATLPLRRADPETKTQRWSIAAVIPTHNRATLIGRAVESALEQRRPPDEVIVVDDGSTDDTASRLSAYGDRIRLITQPRVGQSKTRNAGVASSQSDFVAFLDSDDIWDPSHLLRIERAIEATEGQAVLYFSDALSGDPRYAGLTFWGINRFAFEAPHELSASSGDWLFGGLHPIINFSVSVIRRDAYLAVGGADSSLVRRVDTHLFFKLAACGRMCAVAGPAATLTADDPASVTSSTPDGGETYLNCTVWLYDDLLQRGEFTPAQRRVLRQRLADGYWDLARLRGIRAPIGALLNFAQATRYAPTMFPKRLSNRARRLGRGATQRSASASAN